ncbi:MAG: hypothetical protein KA314_18105 [Chloroflexi bacterium]|nr:hypothetical protein [Chloroflexota bacterium]MBP8057747.1 hypothetical protein [Chloroflexota bacterium]
MSTPPPLPPNDLIEIRDPEIDGEALMNEIRGRITRRRQELGYDNRRFPAFGTTDYPGEPDDIPYDEFLHYHLRQVNRIYNQVETQPLLTDSPSTRIPVLGRIWRLIRGGAHNLVLFYVNRNITQQVNVNRHLISVINRLTAQLQEQQRQILALEEEVRRKGESQR